ADGFLLLDGAAINRRHWTISRLIKHLESGEKLEPSARARLLEILDERRPRLRGDRSLNREGTSKKRFSRFAVRQEVEAVMQKRDISKNKAIEVIAEKLKRTPDAVRKLLSENR